MIFSEKYRPLKISEVIGQQYAMSSLMKFIAGRKKPYCILIHGPIGCGKNSAIKAIVSEMNFELVELNASSLRSREEIKKIVRGAIFQKSLFQKKKLIVIDEIESISSREKSGLLELASLIDLSTYPIILIANNPFSKNISFLKRKYNLIQFKKLEAEDIIAVLKNVCKKESIKYSEIALKKLALLSAGDARAAINDLQASGKDIEDEIAISKRDQEIGIFTALRMIFKSRSFEVLNALENVDMPPYEAMLWIDENLPVEYDLFEIEKAYNCLSKADIFSKRVSRHNHWHFFVYINAMLTVGVCFSKRKNDERFVAYKRLTRLLKQWQSNREMKDEVAGKFGKEMHCSRRKIFREMPYLKMIYKNSNDAEKEGFIEKLDLNSDEENFLLS